MRFRRRALLAVLALCSTGCAPDLSDRVTIVRDVAVRSGDDSRWADPELDDSDWSRMPFWEVPGPETVAWLRAEVEISPGMRRAGRPLGLYISGMASHEIFWDGEPVGRGGVPAPRAADEEPGPIEAHYAIPDRLATPGEHLIAIRTSAHHRGFDPHTGYWALLIGEYDVLLLAGAWLTLISSVSLSGMVMVALFALALFLADRRDRSNLLLSAICFVAAALLVAESWRAVFGYTYDWHLVRLVVVTVLTVVLNFVLLLFLVVRFPGRGARWLLGLALAGFAVATLSPGWDGKAMLMHATGLVLGLAWTVRAWWAERRVATTLVVLGLSTALAVYWWEPARFGDLSLYFALDFLLLCLLASHALATRRLRREREAALMRSARLEIELLKRHIQPHYLMNTLTALSEWIEEEPAIAASMIQSLSEEFRLLAEISDRRLIRMEDELRLCRVHLEIMSRRKGCRYGLDVDGVDPEALVPPALFHTLIENGVTHAPAGARAVEISLRAERCDGARRYVVEAPLDPDDSAEAGEEGTGLRYVRARLEEAFGRGWELRAGPVGGVWRTVVTIDG
ncbi:MAG: histidine kinase [Thermoanaerobaculia bacterium]|nr:histidine kinase [Thermoanaerobaculia bacterium]